MWRGNTSGSDLLGGQCFPWGATRAHWQQLRSTTLISTPLILRERQILDGLVQSVWWLVNLHRSTLSLQNSQLSQSDRFSSPAPFLFCLQKYRKHNVFCLLLTSERMPREPLGISNSNCPLLSSVGPSSTKFPSTGGRVPQLFLPVECWSPSYASRWTLFLSYRFVGAGRICGQDRQQWSPWRPRTFPPT